DLGGLRRKDGLRCHVGFGCRRGGQCFYRIVIPGRRQTGTLASDYRRRTAFQRCIGNKKQFEQDRTYYCKEGKNRHWRTSPGSFQIRRTCRSGSSSPQKSPSVTGQTSV